MTRHRFIVVIDVEGPEDLRRGRAERWLHTQLNRSSFRRSAQVIAIPNEDTGVGQCGRWERAYGPGSPFIKAWYVAEDNRHDRSTEPAAVLLPLGVTQEEARAHLHERWPEQDWEQALLEPEPLDVVVPTDGPFRFDGGRVIFNPGSLTVTAQEIRVTPIEE